MTRGQGPGCKNFCRPPRLLLSCGQPAPSTAPLHSMSHIPHTQVQEHDLALDLPILVGALVFCHWLPWTLDKESSGSPYLCGLKDREMLFSAVDHPSPLRQHVWHQNSLWTFHSTLQPGRPQHFLADGIGTASWTTSAVSQALSPFLSAVLSHTCSIYANIFSMLDCRLDVFIFKVSWFWQWK